MSQPRRVAIMLDLEWPYKRHAETYAGVQRYAQEHDWDSFIDEYAGDSLPARRGRAVPYDGVIARANQKLARRAKHLGVPVVNSWFSSPVWKSLPGVFPDYQAIGRMRAEHLLARGFRRFAAVVAAEDRAQRTELAAFCQLIAETGYDCTTSEVPLDPNSSLTQWRETQRAMSTCIKRWKPPIGVYVGSESDGRMVAQVCRHEGWRVPEDVAIIAGWNEETYCEHLSPTLTSVEIDCERVGYEAARLLDELMDEADARQTRGKKAKPNKKDNDKQDPDAAKADQPAEPRHILMPPRGLVVRESTDFFAVENEVLRAALEYIAANCSEKIRPADVAKATSVEPRTLQRRFKKYLGRGIGTEIRRVRLERAKRELAQTDRTIASISHHVGFGPPMRMYEVFCRELGVTPSEYRRQRQSELGETSSA